MADEETEATPNVNNNVCSEKVPAAKGRILACVLPAMVLPLFASLLYYVFWAGSTVAIVTYGATKVFTVVWPIVAVFVIERAGFPRGPLDRRRHLAGLPLGVLTGLAIGGVIVGAYFLSPLGDYVQGFAGKVIAKVAEMHIAEPVRYIGFCIFLAGLHSLIEEFFWRWYVFGRLSKVIPAGPAYLLASLAFAAHHYVVLGCYFSFMGAFFFGTCVGRGANWMERDAGYQRDVAVLKTIRTHAGSDVIIGVDANTGYGLAQTKRLMRELGDFNFAFVEEMFPETIGECLDLKRFIAEQGFKTLVADGESIGRVYEFKPYVAAGAFDILQGDMNNFGFEGILAEAALAQTKGLQVAPHNWGSLIGYYMQLHVGRAIPNFYRAERDPLSTPVLIAEGYKIEDGYAAVPDAPGLGLRINEEKFRDSVKVRFDLKA